jgi:LDH2 family malate/lactate/ureidoglycolate dehydrogenase
MQPRVANVDLERYVSRIFVAAGVAPAAAAGIAAHLVAADAAGVGTHGVSRVSMYLSRFTSGAFRLAPEVRIEQTSPGTLAVDADFGLGAAVCYPVVDRLVAIARDHGTASAVIAHVGHLGALRLFLEPAIAAGMGMLLVQYNAPSMSLPGMTEALIGNNPIAFGFPGGSGPPIVVDLSCSVAARGKIIDSARDGEPIPPGWALDSGGEPTTDAKAALAGMLLPLAGHKGIALAMIAECLGGLLTDSLAAPSAQLEGRGATAGAGCFMIVVDLEKFVPAVVLAERVDAWRAGYRARAAGYAHVPGEGFANTGSAPGTVRVSRAVLTELAGVAADLGISEPLATIA